MIPFGPWHPDKAAINTQVCREAVNCLPGAAGFRPSKGLAPLSSALTGDCLGAAVVLKADGQISAFAGDATKLYKLDTSLVWQDVSRLVGGPYASGAGERWHYTAYGDLVLATTIADVIQVYDLASSTNFTALGGSPPRCRYIDVVRDFVVVGGIFQNERRVQWSGLGNPTWWTPGGISSQSSDYQDIPSGGPVRAVIGGEVGYAFQAAKVNRMTYVPGAAEIFQFDEIEGARGLAAPNSMTRVGRLAYYLAKDGFYEFDTATGASKPIGVGKWGNWFMADIKAGTEALVFGGSDASQRMVYWSYIPLSSSSAIPVRTLCYSWEYDEATISMDNVPITALAQWLTQGVTLDTMNAFGNLDTLPLSLDSPVWRGGAGALGLFSGDRKLSFFSGATLPASIVTADGQKSTRTFVSGTRPHFDTSSVRVALAARERDSDAVTYETAEMMEDTGICPAHVSGNLIRAKITTDTGATWTQGKGLETNPNPNGSGSR